MKRTPELFLRDILKASQHILDFVNDLDYDQFINDEKTSSAVIRKFEIIGEAAKNVPDIIKQKYSDVPWKDISGMRDHLIHAYFGVDNVIVWDTIQSDIPKIIKSVSQILDDLDQ